MSRGQRLLLVIGLPVLGRAMHVMLCEWGYRRLIRDSRAVIVTVEHATAPSATGRGFETRLGVFVAFGTNRDVAIFCGVVAPLVMVGVATYIGLGCKKA